jgi:hypothetical protein
MAALFVFQWDWLGPVVIIANEADPAQGEPAPRRGHGRPGRSTRIRSIARGSAHG